MPLPANPYSIAELLPGVDIHDILDNQLRQINDTDHMIKYNVEGHPHVYVRTKPEWDQGDWDRITRAADAFNRLPAYEICALPYLPVLHRNQPYIVTQKVRGKPLADAFAQNPSPMLTTAIDQQWGRLARYAMGSKLFGLPSASDIERPEQYMHGSVSTDRVEGARDRVRLVDLDEYTNDFKGSESESVEYEAHLLSLADAIVLMERKLPRLSTARESMLSALAIAETSTARERLVTDAVCQSLRDNIRLVYVEGRVAEVPQVPSPH